MIETIIFCAGYNVYAIKMSHIDNLSTHLCNPSKAGNVYIAVPADPLVRNDIRTLARRSPSAVYAFGLLLAYH